MISRSEGLRRSEAREPNFTTERPKPRAARGKGMLRQIASLFVRRSWIKKAAVTAPGVRSFA